MKFRVGDKVRQKRSGSNTNPNDNGKEAIVTVVGGSYLRGKTDDGILIDCIGEWKLANTRWRGEGAFELVHETTGTEELKTVKEQGGKEFMYKIISDNYEKTSDALLVEKYIGGQMTNSFIGGLVVSANKDAILTEAKRLDKEAKARDKAC